MLGADQDGALSWDTPLVFLQENTHRYCAHAVGRRADNGVTWQFRLGSNPYADVIRATGGAKFVGDSRSEGHPGQQRITQTTMIIVSTTLAELEAAAGKGLTGGGSI